MSSWGHGLVFFGPGLVSDEASRARTSEMESLGDRPNARWGSWGPTVTGLGLRGPTIAGPYPNWAGAAGTLTRLGLLGGWPFATTGLSFGLALETFRNH